LETGGESPGPRGELGQGEGPQGAPGDPAPGDDGESAPE